MTQLCIVCQKNKAILHVPYGILPCLACGRAKKIKYLPYEFAPDSVKESRKEYSKDIIQSSRDGVLSKERLEAYGTRGIKVTQEQIDKSEYVWNDIKPYKEGNPKNI